MLAGLKVQQEELSELRDSFIFIDKNQDGTLSLDELKNGLKNLCLFEILQDHAYGEEDCYQNIMENVDLDGDGKIDYLEFIQAAINHKALLNKQNIQIIFDMFDQDKDGKISVTEIKNVFSSSFDGGETMLREIMSEVDKNNDNCISHEEFNDALTELLRRSVKLKQ